MSSAMRWMESVCRIRCHSIVAIAQCLIPCVNTNYTTSLSHHCVEKSTITKCLRTTSTIASSMQIRPIPLCIDTQNDYYPKRQSVPLCIASRNDETFGDAISTIQTPIAPLLFHDTIRLRRNDLAISNRNISNRYSLAWLATRRPPIPHRLPSRSLSPRLAPTTMRRSLCAIPKHRIASQIDSHRRRHIVAPHRRSRHRSIGSRPKMRRYATGFYPLYSSKCRRLGRHATRSHRSPALGIAPHIYASRSL